MVEISLSQSSFVSFLKNKSSLLSLMVPLRIFPFHKRFSIVETINILWTKRFFQTKKKIVKPLFLRAYGGGPRMTRFMSFTLKALIFTSGLCMYSKCGYLKCSVNAKFV